MLRRIWEVIKNRHDLIQEVILVCVGVMEFSLPIIQKYTLEHGQGKEYGLPSAFPLKLKNSNPPENIGAADMRGSVARWLKPFNGHLKYNPYSSKYIFMALPSCLIFFIFSHSTHPTVQPQPNFFQILSLLQALVRALPSFWNIPSPTPIPTQPPLQFSFTRHFFEELLLDSPCGASVPPWKAPLSLCTHDSSLELLCYVVSSASCKFYKMAKTCCQLANICHVSMLC